MPIIKAKLFLFEEGKRKKKVKKTLTFIMISKRLWKVPCINIWFDLTIKVKRFAVIFSKVWEFFNAENFQYFY